MKTINCTIFEYHGLKRIKLTFPYDSHLIEKVKTIPGRAWSKTERCWHIPWRADYLGQIKRVFSGLATVKAGVNPTVSKNIESNHNFPSLQTKTPPIVPKLPPEYLERLNLRRYSRNTIKAYLTHFNLFLVFFSHRPPQSISQDQIKQYLLYLINERQVSGTYQKFNP